MNRKRLTRLIAAVALLLLLTTGVFVMAQSSASFDLSWYVIGNGGGRSSSSSYSVDGTIGQSVIGDSSSASYKGFSVKGKIHKKAPIG